MILLFYYIELRQNSTESTVFSFQLLPVKFRRAVGKNFQLFEWLFFEFTIPDHMYSRFTRAKCKCTEIFGLTLGQRALQRDFSVAQGRVDKNDNVNAQSQNPAPV